MKLTYLTATLLILGNLNAIAKAETFNCPAVTDIDCFKKKNGYYSCSAGGRIQWSVVPSRYTPQGFEKDIVVQEQKGLSGRSTNPIAPGGVYTIDGCLYSYANKDGTEHKQPTNLTMFLVGHDPRKGNCTAETLDSESFDCQK